MALIVQISAILLALIQVLDLATLKGPVAFPGILRTVLVLKTLMPVMFDDHAKSRNIHVFVIPAKAGIQCY